MMRAVVTIACCLLAAEAAVGTRGASAWRSSRAFLSASANLQPGAVARTLAKIEETWRTQAVDFNTCNASAVANGKDVWNCRDPADAFRKSCSTVAGAVLKASGGEPDIVNDYMAEVCAQPVLKGWQQKRCKMFGESITSTKGRPNAARSCQDFWGRFVLEEAHSGQSAPSDAAKKEAATPKQAVPAKAEATRKEAATPKAATPKEAVTAKAEAAPKEAVTAEKPDLKSLAASMLAAEDEKARTLEKRADADEEEEAELVSDAKRLLAKAHAEMPAAPANRTKAPAAHKAKKADKPKA